MKTASSTSPDELGICHLSVPTDNIPDRINPCPSSGSRWDLRFAFVMRFEPQNPTMRFESTRRGTIRAFHKRNTALQKTLEVDGNYPRKRAFGRFCRSRAVTRWDVRLRRVRLPEREHSFSFWLRPAPMPLFCGLRWEGFSAMYH